MQSKIDSVLSKRPQPTQAAPPDTSQLDKAQLKLVKHVKGINKNKKGQFRRTGIDNSQSLTDAQVQADPEAKYIKMYKSIKNASILSAELEKSKRKLASLSEKSDQSQQQETQIHQQQRTIADQQIQVEDLQQRNNEISRQVEQHERALFEAQEVARQATAQSAILQGQIEQNQQNYHQYYQQHLSEMQELAQMQNQMDVEAQLIQDKFLETFQLRADELLYRPEDMSWAEWMKKQMAYTADNLKKMINIQTREYQQIVNEKDKLQTLVNQQGQDLLEMKEELETYRAEIDNQQAQILHLKTTVNERDLTLQQIYARDTPGQLNINYDNFDDASSMYTGQNFLQPIPQESDTGQMGRNSNNAIRLMGPSIGLPVAVNELEDYGLGQQANTTGALVRSNTYEVQNDNLNELDDGGFEGNFDQSNLNVQNNNEMDRDDFEDQQFVEMRNVHDQPEQVDEYHDYHAKTCRGCIQQQNQMAIQTATINNLDTQLQQFRQSDGALNSQSLMALDVAALKVANSKLEQEIAKSQSLFGQLKEKYVKLQKIENDTRQEYQQFKAQRQVNEWPSAEPGNRDQVSIVQELNERLESVQSALEQQVDQNQQLSIQSEEKISELEAKNMELEELKEQAIQDQHFIKAGPGGNSEDYPFLLTQEIYKIYESSISAYFKNIAYSNDRDVSKMIEQYTAQQQVYLDKVTLLIQRLDPEQTRAQLGAIENSISSLGMFFSRAYTQRATHITISKELGYFNQMMEYYYNNELSQQRYNQDIGGSTKRNFHKNLQRELQKIMMVPAYSTELNAEADFKVGRLVEKLKTLLARIEAMQTQSFTKIDSFLEKLQQNEEMMQEMIYFATIKDKSSQQSYTFLMRQINNIDFIKQYLVNSTSVVYMDRDVFHSTFSLLVEVLAEIQKTYANDHTERASRMLEAINKHVQSIAVNPKTLKERIFDYVQSGINK